MRPPQLRCELFSSIYLPYIHRVDYCSYRTSTSFAVLSSHVASYMISVRQTRGLPRASFRFHITMDTPAFWLCAYRLQGRTRDFHPLEFAHAGRTKKVVSP